MGKSRLNLIRFKYCIDLHGLSKEINILCTVIHTVLQRCFLLLKHILMARDMLTTIHCFTSGAAKCMQMAIFERPHKYVCIRKDSPQQS